VAGEADVDGDGRVAAVGAAVQDDEVLLDGRGYGAIRRRRLRKEMRMFPAQSLADPRQNAAMDRALVFVALENAMARAGDAFLLTQVEVALVVDLEVEPIDVAVAEVGAEGQQPCLKAKRRRLDGKIARGSRRLAFRLCPQEEGGD